MAGCNAPPRRVYSPSPWELAWRARVTDNPDGTRSWLRHCAVLKNETEAMQHWLDIGEARTSSSNGQHALARFERWNTWNESVISFHTIVCSETGAIIKRVPIEPLVSFLRHPRHTCFNRVSFKYARSYLFPMRIDEHVPSPPGRCLFFDLGASLYSFGTGGASLQWFVELCKPRHICAWTCTAHHPPTVFPCLPSSTLTCAWAHELTMSATLSRLSAGGR